MGLCKCPQRKVTNIFCYEHRVNVCEHCLMQNHPKCVVDTYRNWITDSVFSPKCSLCSENLDSGETVRLLCFHIVHWDCLDKWARSLPPTTAPAGYTCPVCNRMCLFPALNQVSPIADELRRKMGEVNWSRAGLGLPLLDNDIGSGSNSNVLSNGTTISQDSTYQNSFSSNVGSSPVFENKSEMTKFGNVETAYQNNAHAGSMTPKLHGSVYVKNAMGMGSSNHVEPSTSFMSSHKGSYTSSPPQLSKSFYGDTSADSSSNTNPRKPVNKVDYEMPLLFDEDEHKYRRKSPFEALSRWLKNANPANNRRKTRKRTIIYAIVTIIILVVMFMILFGRNEDYDEGFDPKLNPNVFIGDREAVVKSHDDS